MVQDAVPCGVSRRATLEDVPALVAMGEAFRTSAPHRPGGYDRVAVARVLRHLIGAPNGLVLIGQGMAIGGHMWPLFYDPARTLMEVTFWPRARGGMAMLTAFEAESRAMGATDLHLSVFCGPHEAAMQRLLARAGYSPVERRFIKEL